MSWIQDEIAHLEHLALKWEDEMVTEVQTLEADAQPLFKQIQSELSADGYAIAKTELTTAITAAMSGGGLTAIGAAIASSIPSLISTLKLDGTQAEKNALYGIAAIVQAQVTASAASTPSPAPAPAAA